MSTRARQMPMEFEVFRSSCAEHGYTERVSDCGTYYVMFTKNGVKTEIKPRWYTVGYGRSQSELDVLERVCTVGPHGFIQRPCTVFAASAIHMLHPATMQAGFYGPWVLHSHTHILFTRWSSEAVDDVVGITASLAAWCWGVHVNVALACHLLIVACLQPVSTKKSVARLQRYPSRLCIHHACASVTLA